MQLSILNALRGVPAETPKLYVTSLQSHGFESGVGRAGEYKGHAHRFVWDIIFSPDGLTLMSSDNPSRHGTLLIVAPETYFGPVGLGAFWFLKFGGRPGVAKMPDKVEEPLAHGGLWLFSDSGAGQMPWYPSGHYAPSTVVFSMCNGNLNVAIGDTQLQVTL
ncbi:MAG TPA: hypothetical protein VGB92_01840 [Longimicrobium sp.]|jgi:hypothetical protein